MNTKTASDLAEYVIATPRAHERDLRQVRIRRLPSFGSVARGGADSHVDLLTNGEARGASDRGAEATGIHDTRFEPALLAKLSAWNAYSQDERSWAYAVKRLGKI